MEEIFNFDKLNELYKTNIMYSHSIGIDRVGNKKFETDLWQNISLIINKVQNKKYSFSPYRTAIIPKGINKFPRKICIPTIRDRLTILALKEFISNEYTENERLILQNKSVQVIVAEMKECISLKDYKYYVKMDITGFYDNIDHDILIDKLNKRIENENVIDLISKAITVEQVLDNGDRIKPTVGVPQGLSVSNILANIYLNDFDLENNLKQDYKYFRYVDDIFILCKSKEKASEILRKLSRKLKMQYFLEVNQEKTKDGLVKDGVTYLGYRFEDGTIRVREESLKRFEKSIESIFSQYVNTVDEKKNLEFLIWNLNLKVTGGIKDNKKYGWVFFFSQIEDEQILFHLDNLMQKYVKRFKLEKELQGKVKKFIRTYKEIKNNLSDTKYIPKFDSFSLDDQKDFLIRICRIDIENKNEEKINRLFNNTIFSNLKRLERDIQMIS